MGPMTWTLTDDVSTCVAAVRETLARDPERNTVMMSVLASLIKQGPYAFGAEPPVLGWRAGADTTPSAVMLRTPPHPMHFTTFSAGAPGEAARELAETLAASPVLADPARLDLVIGAEPDAEAFAVAWSALTGGTFEVTQRQRLYRLGALTPPDPPAPGTGRVVTEADSDLVRDWEEAFAAEVHQAGPAPAVTRDKLLTGRVVLWELAGEPLSMAQITPVISGVARIGQVYTPPGHRGRGYGGAATVAATELARARGAGSVILFTDLANRTSNELYQRLGYRPVEDKVLIGFRHTELM